MTEPTSARQSSLVPFTVLAMTATVIVALTAIGTVALGFEFINHSQFSLGGHVFKNAFGNVSAALMIGGGGAVLLSLGMGVYFAKKASESKNPVLPGGLLLTPADFHTGKWRVPTAGKTFEDGKTQMFIFDETTDKMYLNDSESTIRDKLIASTFAVLVPHQVLMVGNAAYRALKVISLSHFWLPSEEGKEYDLKGRLSECALDFMRITLFPLALLLLFMITVYGWFDPRQGRKWYTSVEKLIYGEDGATIAPCFRSEFTKHLLGGDVNQRNSW